MAIQMILCVETKKSADTDSIYILDTISRWYKVDNKVKISKINMNSKSRYNSKDVVREIAKKEKEFVLGDTHVIYFIDTDQYDTYVVVDPDSTTDNGNIESDVFLYYDDTENKKLYLVGSNGRTIVDYKKAKWKTNLQDDDMTYSEKNVFANKSLFKTP